MISLGQMAYEAYAQVTSWRNYMGGQMPHWFELPERIREAWESAAEAVALSVKVAADA
jgi:hypothetical protein